MGFLDGSAHSTLNFGIAVKYTQMLKDMRILGIDPGTVSFDLCLLDDDRVTFEDSIPSSVVAEKPEELALKCLSLKPEVIIAPSGYGLPNRHFSELTRERCLSSLWFEKVRRCLSSKE